MKRTHIKISGRVKGVFFRAFVKRNAEKLGVKGWVSNIEEGVEAVFEGEGEAVNKLIKLCRKGPLTAKVTSLQAREQPHKAEFENFEIRY